MSDARSKQMNVPRLPMQFLREEDGTTSILGLFITMTAAMTLGLAVDHANGWRVQTQLQVAADAAALAAAANLDDLDRARDLALQVAAMNLGDNDAIRSEDIEFGTWNEATLTFALGADPNAVRITPRTSDERGNRISTYLMRLVGVDGFNVGADAIATAQMGAGTGASAGCEDAMFLSENFIQTGGGNEFYGAVCVHAELGLSTGGGDIWVDETTFSAQNLNLITLNSFSPPDLSVESITTARSMAPEVLPQLSGLWSSLFNPLYWGGEEIAYYEDGDLPSFVFDEAGEARIVRKSGWWTVQPEDIEPYTIYVVNGGAQFAGNVDASNVAFLVSGYLGIGGGDNMHFEDVFLFGNQLNLAGNVSWGPREGACGLERYSVYLFGRQSLSMGGWGSDTHVNNLMGIAPVLMPGGAMVGTGVYFEMSAPYTSLGGNLRIEACGVARLSEFGQAEFDEPEEIYTGSYLVH